MECSHLRENPSLKEHVLPCRHRLCLNCTRGVPGLMQGDLFSCQICGNFSQYVNPRQTVEGLPDTDAENQNLGSGDGGVNHCGVEQHNYIKEQSEATPSHNHSPRSPGGRGEVYDSRNPNASCENTRGRSLECEIECDTESHEVTDEEYYNVWKQTGVISDEDEGTLEEQFAMLEVYGQRGDSGDGMRATSEDQKVDQHIQHTQEELLRRIAGERLNEPAERVDTSSTSCQHEARLYYYCAECDIPVCEECKNHQHISHHTNKLEETHESPRSGDQHHPASMCVPHGLRFSMYCKECNKYLCKKCCEVWHDNLYYYMHNARSIRDAEKDLSTDFIGLEDQFREGLKRYRDEEARDQRELNEILQQAEDLKHRVDDETKLAKERLDSNAEDMKARIEKRVAEVLEARKVHSGKIRELGSKIDEADREIANAQRLNGYDLPAAKLCADEVTKSLRALKYQSIPPPRESFDLECGTRNIPKSEDILSPVHLVSKKRHYYREWD